MGRLDTFLVEKKMISTRSRAKRAIVCGLIKVNGKIILKPAYSVSQNDKVEILNELATKSIGYWKLHAIYNSIDFKIFNSTDIVLDLGSSAGGFLEFVAERCCKVHGVEISDKFTPILFNLKEKYPNVSIQIADVFKLTSQEIPDFGQIDIILNDLTLDPIDSVKIITKFIPSLKNKGYIIMAIKIGNHTLENLEKFINNSFEEMGLTLIRVLDIDPDKKEVHIIAQKK